MEPVNKESGFPLKRSGDSVIIFTSRVKDKGRSETKTAAGRGKLPECSDNVPVLRVEGVPEGKL